MFQKTNDYTAQKYYAEVSSLEMNPSELREYCEAAKARGTKVGSIIDPKRRAAYAEYLANNPLTNQPPGVSSRC